jgi:hypothetical protein
MLITLPACGLISATLTPIHLVQQSEMILTAKIPGKDIGAKMELEIVGTLKGKTPTRLSVDLGKAAAEHAKAARTQLGAFADQPVLLFAAPQVGRAYLHVHGMWLKLGGGRNGNWDLEVADESMQATWAGGTDMLQRCVQYILSQGDNASVPVEAGTTWRAIRKIGSIAGTARDIAAVDLVGDGKLCLFVAGEKGDRLLQPGKDTFVDITEKVKLASRSRLAAWGDFNGDGRMSLASFDGRTLTLWTQSADGSFSATKAGGSFTLPNDCVGMTTIAVAGSNSPGLLLSPSSGPPVLLKPAGKNAFETLPPLPPAVAAGLSTAGCPGQTSRRLPQHPGDFCRAMGSQWPACRRPLGRSAGRDVSDLPAPPRAEGVQLSAVSISGEIRLRRCRLAAVDDCRPQRSHPRHGRLQNRLRPVAEDTYPAGSADHRRVPSQRRHHGRCDAVFGVPRTDFSAPCSTVLVGQSV